MSSKQFSGIQASNQSARRPNRGFSGRFRLTELVLTGTKPVSTRVTVGTPGLSAGTDTILPKGVFDLFQSSFPAMLAVEITKHLVEQLHQHFHFWHRDVSACVLIMRNYDWLDFVEGVLAFRGKT